MLAKYELVIEQDLFISLKMSVNVTIVEELSQIYFTQNSLRL